MRIEDVEKYWSVSLLPAEVHHVPDELPVAASTPKLDQELAQQLRAMAAVDLTSGERSLRPAIVEAALWAAAAIGAWILIVRLG